MGWRESKAHGNEWYHCSCSIAGFNARNIHYIHYVNVSSAIRSVPHGPGFQIPTSSAVLKDVEESNVEMSSSRTNQQTIQNTNTVKITDQCYLIKRN